MICAVDWIDGDGVNTLSVAEPEGQPTHRSLGLVTYLDVWFRDDAKRQWLMAMDLDGDDD